MFNIVLVEPEIPQNAGNIVRTCVATGSTLHMVRPLGFLVSDKHLKRAGLDYWYDAQIFYHDSFSEIIEKNPDKPFYYLSTKGARTYAQVCIEPGAFLVFGKETKGLPEELLEKNYTSVLRIPMIGNIRSLNLANSVAIVIYEAHRQHGFKGLNPEGHLTNSNNN